MRIGIASTTPIWPHRDSRAAAKIMTEPIMVIEIDKNSATCAGVLSTASKP
jgi:hypothetical protein